MVTTINLPLLGVLSRVKEGGVMAKLLVEAIASVDGEDLIYEKSVRDLLWGYE